MIIVIIIIIITIVIIIIIIIIIIIMIQNKVFAQCIIKIKMSHDVNTPPTHLDIKKKKRQGLPHYLPWSYIVHNGENK